MPSHALSPNWPIGVFDSGVGGLSILSALHKQLPGEDFLYLADSAFAPYGERDEAFVSDRAQAALKLLQHHHPIKALVVACNTATALAIHTLREQNPHLPIFGVEPALKPAAAHSRTHRVGVIATAATIGSQKFADLLSSLSEQTEFVTQACDGLAEAIEQQWKQGSPQAVVALCKKHLGQMGTFGHSQGQMDTLVLGCTHYPFAHEALQAITGSDISLFDTGEPVARRVQHVLQTRGLVSSHTKGQLSLLATGETINLEQAARHWLGLDALALKV